MTSPTRLFACLALLVSLTASTRAAARPDRAITPIRVESAQMESVTFANLVLRAPTVPEVLVSGESVRIEILEELRRHGHRALGAENLVFGQDDAGDAHFALGGTVRELRCVARRRCTIGIEWELLDRTTKKVVYKVMTRAGELDIRLNNGAGVARDLVRNALRSLLSRPKFVAALTSEEAVESATRAAPAKFVPCSAPELTLPEQVEATMAATLVLESKDAHGSGFLISPDGLVLTAAHVAQVPGIQARLRDGSVRPFHVLRMDIRHDVALGRIDGAIPGCVALRATPATVGEDVFAIGAPADRELAFSLTRGIVSGMREHKGLPLLQTDASLNAGNSGGPLLDRAGHVMAIVSAKVMGVGVEGIAFGVPVGHALTRLSLEASADETDAALLGGQPIAAALAAPQAVATIQDLPDAPVSLAPKPRKRRDRGPGWVRALRYGGGGVATLGASVALFSFFKVDSDVMERDEWLRLRRMNDVGWTIAGLGALTMASSWVLPPLVLKKPEKGRPPRASPAAVKPAPTARIGAGTVTFEMRF